MVVRTSLGRELKAARQRAGLTQKDIARQVGCVSTYVAHMENGTMQQAPSVEFLTNFAAATGADIDGLCYLAGKIPMDMERALLYDREFMRRVRGLLNERGHDGTARAV